MIFSRVTKGALEFNSLAVREDADGRMGVWAVAPSGCTAKDPVIINFSNATPFGYMAQTFAIGSGTGGCGWVGIPEKTLTSGQSGMFQIGGVASQVVWQASASNAAGYALVWCTSSGLIQAGAVATASLAYKLGTATGVCGCALYNATSTLAHDIFLFGLPTRATLA